jgi:predicted HAD superfamily Cof-like phosphohydrolase
MSPTNYDKVVEFNKSFGLPHNNTEQKDILRENPKLSKLRVDLCTEEIKELNEAFETKDFIEVIDALTDELYVLYGAASSFGFNMNIALRDYLNRNIHYDANMSNYEIIYKMCQDENISIPDNIYRELFSTTIPQNIDEYMKKINVSMNDLIEHHQSKNYYDLKNTLIFLLIITYRIGIMLGINLNTSFDIVHSSNMSKLCKTDKEAIETVADYKQNDARYDTPNYRPADTGNYWVVYNESTGKILKSINYTQANFTSML